MARFFKYKSLDDLRAENSRLGIDLCYSEDFAPLFRPLKIGGRTVGNRFCIHPMEGCDGNPDGTPGELTLRRYERFGAGGAKVVWGEATAVLPEGRANPRQLLINDATLPTFARMVETTRRAHGADDFLFGLQLTHSGRYAWPHPLIATHDALLDPRTLADKASGRVVDEAYPLMSDAELEAIVPAYVAAARRAREVGFDFVDVKQCHHYLLNELLGATERPGEFGGSLENRTRLPRLIIEAIRREVPDILVGVRMNVYDGIPFRKPSNEQTDGVPVDYAGQRIQGWGLHSDNPLSPDLSEVIAWIDTMQLLGVAIINVTMGNPYAAPHFGRPFEYPPPDGYDAPEHPLIGVQRHFHLATTLQKRFPYLPFVGTGYSYLQEFLPHAGAANVRDANIALVGIGRASLSQPDLVKQLMEHGKLDRKRICRTFSYCTALMRAKHNEYGQFASGCPPFDKEVYGPIWQDALNIKSD